MPMVMIVEEAKSRTISRGIRITTAFFILRKKQKKKKERKCLSVTTIFLGTSPMVFTPTHVYTEKYIYVTSTVYRLECEENEEVNCEEI